MQVVDSNKGAIAKGVIIDKYLKLLSKVPGGGAMRTILEPFLTQFQRNYDYETKKEYESKNNKKKMELKK